MFLPAIVTLREIVTIPLLTLFQFLSSLKEKPPNRPPAFRVKSFALPLLKIITPPLRTIVSLTTPSARTVKDP